MSIQEIPDFFSRGKLIPNYLHRTPALPNRYGSGLCTPRARAQSVAIDARPHEQYNGTSLHEMAVDLTESILKLSEPG